mmetsp:Transcript_3487/g.10155  ORF Transcript_3487/g.10155 Transcript_3487/m.10155 type:complete len:248 (+) Transcript_3487:565-1308(+)
MKSSSSPGLTPVMRTRRCDASDIGAASIRLKTGLCACKRKACAPRAVPSTGPRRGSFVGEPSPSPASSSAQELVATIASPTPRSSSASLSESGTNQMSVGMSVACNVEAMFAIIFEVTPGWPVDAAARDWARNDRHCSESVGQSSSSQTVPMTEKVTVWSKFMCISLWCNGGCSGSNMMQLLGLLISQGRCVGDHTTGANDGSNGSGACVNCGLCTLRSIINLCCLGPTDDKRKCGKLPVSVQLKSK